MTSKFYTKVHISNDGFCKNRMDKVWKTI